jgi:transcriptional regulator of acetoin/glycerol metabolism
LLRAGSRLRHSPNERNDWSTKPANYMKQPKICGPTPQRSSLPCLPQWQRRSRSSPPVARPWGYRSAIPPVESEPVLALDQALQELTIFIGSALMRNAAERAAVVADDTCPVLLLGETGTGKERFANLIHRLSSRHNQPLLAINCASIPKELAESYLFGHVRGAFTGAASDKKGVFEEAHQTTLFLDEVAELSLDIQAKLLRSLAGRRRTASGKHRSS